MHYTSRCPRNYILLEDIEEAIKPLRLQYQQLTHRDLSDYYDGDTSAMGPGHMLDIMESFHRLTPMHKFGEMHWRCCCTKGFRNLACHHTVLFSALWDPELRVPAGLSEVMIPNRKGKVYRLYPTAFNVDKAQEEEDETGPPPMWKPKIAGLPQPVTPPPAKKGKRDGGLKTQRICAAESDFEQDNVVQKKRVGRPSKLDLQARAASQPVHRV